MTRTPALFDNADVLAEAVVREVGTNIERLFGAYPELAYANALRERRLPPNIEVSEFFFLAGRWLSVPVARQNYISANYTHAARYRVAVHVQR